MRDFVIMTDSCCDLPAQLANELGIVVLPLSMLLGEDSFKNYLDGREIGFKEFYDRVRNGAMPTTSAVSVGDSPVVPARTMASTPASICRRIRTSSKG